MTAVEISASIGRCNTTYVSVHPVIPRKINGVKGYSVTRKGRGSWGWRHRKINKPSTVAKVFRAIVAPENTKIC